MVVLETEREKCCFIISLCFEYPQQKPK